MLTSTVCYSYVMSAQVSEWSLTLINKGSCVSNMLRTRKPFTLSLRNYVYWNLKMWYWQVRCVPSMLWVHKSVSGVWLWSIKGIASQTCLEHENPLHLVYGTMCIEIWNVWVCKSLIVVCEFLIPDLVIQMTKHVWVFESFMVVCEDLGCSSLWRGLWFVRTC